MYQSYLISLGDLRLTAALAGAVVVWLVAARAYRAACWWCVAYGGALGAVAASKILYLGWGLQIAAVQFKAASGHAAGTAAVLPIVLYLLAMPIVRSKANFALAAGWMISAAVAFALVAHDEHSSSEALAGWCLGMLASAVSWSRMRRKLILPSRGGVGAALAMMTVIASGMQVVPVGPLMSKTALALSGEHRTHAWNDC